jgi:hypothetical protein
MTGPALSAPIEYPDGPTPDTVDECFDLHEVKEDEEQRFANWYAYYRTRLLTAQTVLHRVMGALDGRVRVSFQALDQSGTVDLDPLTERFGVWGARRDEISTQQELFFEWVNDLTPTSGKNNAHGRADSRGGIRIARRRAEGSP